MRTSLLTFLGLAITVLAVNPPTPDPSGAKNVGNGKGQQFITGQCLSSADCASTCCAGPAGICSGIGAAFQAGKTGCGFGDSANGGAAAADATSTSVSASTTSIAPAKAATVPDAAGSQNVGKGDGSQFITGQCLSNADCASTCCASPKGVCSAVLVANENGKTGCGFVSSKRLVRF